MSKSNGNYTTGRNRVAPKWKRQERDMYDRHQSGYCPHGVYVGGCGIDWMCGRCESGEEPMTKAERKKYDRTRKANYYLNRVLYLLKRDRWEAAEAAFTTANRWSYNRYSDAFVRTFKAFMEYGRTHDKFKEA